MSAPVQRFPVGVIVERRKAKSQWIEHVWQPVSVLAGVPEAAPWTLLSDDGVVASFYAGSADVVLYRAETAQYVANLATGAPALWIVLRPTGVDPPYDVVAVTADPSEGEAFTEAGNDMVDNVPMPAPVREAMEAFVAEHHVERPFVKRQRDRADPEALARREPRDGDE